MMCLTLSSRGRTVFPCQWITNTILCVVTILSLSFIVDDNIIYRCVVTEAFAPQRISTCRQRQRIPMILRSTSNLQRIPRLFASFQQEPLKENKDDTNINIIQQQLDSSASDETNNPTSNNADDSPLDLKDMFNKSRAWGRLIFRKLAALSLEDYEWRSSVFKTNEADRRVEESIARMMGEDPSYLRPMDATTNLGPLGRAEKKAVKWLTKVIEEEGRRARQIVDSNGQMVRPIDLISTPATTSNEQKSTTNNKQNNKDDGDFFMYNDPFSIENSINSGDIEDEDDECEGNDEIGPLGFLELKAVEFLNSIRDSEKERVATGTLRPKDLDVSTRGPLGNAEAKAVSDIKEIIKAEKLRAEQSRQRGGEVVRPIDVPGPLGEVEMAALNFVRSEQQRSTIDKEANDGKLVRPKDASIPSPLSELEKKSIDGFSKLQEEETERLRSMQRLLEDKRPINQMNYQETFLGLLESLFVGILRAPVLLFQVILRVVELLQSERLPDNEVESSTTLTEFKDNDDVDQSSKGRIEKKKKDVKNDNDDIYGDWS